MFKTLHRLAALVSSLASIKKAYADTFATVPHPFAIYFETTYVCTCRCVFCNRWKDGSQHTARELSYDEMTSLIDQAYDLGVRLVSLSGGEPFLKRGILDAMRYARGKGMITVVPTNGTLINENNVDDVLSAFDYITVSLDSLDRRRHDEIRGVAGTFDKAMRSIGLLKLRARHTKISVQSVMTARNTGDILEINKVMSARGIDTSFQPVHDGCQNGFTVSEGHYTDFGQDDLSGARQRLMSEYEYPSLLEKMLLRQYYARAFDFLLDPESTREAVTCFAGSLSFMVDPYGEVFPCDPLRTSMGNVRTQTLSQIWCSERMTDFRKVMKNGRTCNCWLLCAAPANLNLSKVIR
jgi:MoaA/NifB/PqqE/SkfB family radical SAM enzyme